MSGQIGRSPTPNKRVGPTMDFYQALEQLEGGAKIASAAWIAQVEYKDDFGVLRDGRVQIHKTSDGKYHDWIISVEDLTCIDWVVV